MTPLLVILLLLAAPAWATSWTASDHAGTQEQVIVIPQGFFSVEIVAHLPNEGMTPGNTYTVTGDVIGIPCAVFCARSSAMVTIDNIVYRTPGAVHALSWDIHMVGSVSVPSNATDTFITVTGPATLIGTFTTLMFATDQVFLDSPTGSIDLTGTLSLFVARSLVDNVVYLPFNTRSGLVATADFPDPPAVAEPRTWLLFITGLTLLIMGRFSASRLGRSSASRQ